MAKFALVYHHSNKKPNTPEEGQADMKDWMEWLEGLGDAALDRGNPFKGSMMVSADGVEDAKAAISGYSLVQAESMDAAIEMAKNCPYTKYGTIEVAEAIEM